MRYRKKPVVIEAFQWDTNTRIEDVPQWFQNAITSGKVINGVGSKESPIGIAIMTLEGKMFSIPKDYIICGVNGELYPCKPDIFEKTYEPDGDS